METVVQVADRLHEFVEDNAMLEGLRFDWTIIAKEGCNPSISAGFNDLKYGLLSDPAIEGALSGFCFAFAEATECDRWLK